MALIIFHHNDTQYVEQWDAVPAVGHVVLFPRGGDPVEMVVRKVVWSLREHTIHVDLEARDAHQVR